MPDAPRPLRNRLWAILGDISLIHWLWTIPISTFTTWLAHRSSMMPNASTAPAEYWAATTTVFFGTLATATTLSRLVVWSVPKLKRWHSPHYLVVSSHGGRTAAVELTHYGESAEWEAWIRIIETMDGSCNPDPLNRQCYLRRGDKSLRSLALRQGESANIVVASVGYNEFSSGSWLGRL